MQPNDTLTVSALTDQIKGTLESTFSNVFVEGEIGQINMHRSGHVYFSLKDEDARIDGVIWRSTVARLTYRPNAGDQVLVFGRLSVYAPHGSYKLVVSRLEPAGLGRLQAAFEASKQRLMAEGLFSETHKKALPFLPKGVGVITSATGAARRDIESVLHRRAPQVPIYLYPANVQGPQSVNELIAGLKRLDKDPKVDVIILGRGGGSLEDLWSFNDEALARIIFACTTPIVSAVGHETDTTISDLVADLRAPTPSAAAELVVPSRDDLLFMFNEIDERLHRAMTQKLRRTQESVLSVATLLRRGVELDYRKLELSRLSNQLYRMGHSRVSSGTLKLRELSAALGRLHPERRLNTQRQRLHMCMQRLQTHVHEKYQNSKLAFGRSVERLDALSPLGVLARGYSLTTVGERVLMSTSQVRVGQEVQVRLSEGSLNATVIEIKSE